MEVKQPARLIGYVRVSTEEQSTNGVSLQAQTERVRAYVSLYGGTLIEIIEDAGVSAKTLRRPGLARALALLDEGHADGLVVAKLDRLTRSVRDLGELLDRCFSDGKADLLSVTEQIDTRSAGGRLVLHVLTSVAQWEREAIGERTKAALSHLRSRGVQLGAVPYGSARVDDLDEDGRRVIKPVVDEIGIAEEISDLREGGLSLRQIADHLTRTGRPTKRGRSWHASTVRSVLSRAA